MSRKLKSADQIETSDCTCESCRRMCKRPCWPTPDGAKKLIDKGMADRLMLDAYVMDDIDYYPDDPSELEKVVYVLCPATRGWRGKEAPWWESLVAMGERLRQYRIAHQLGIKPKYVSVPTHRGCTFRHKGLCRLHDRGLKPLEGRAMHHDTPDDTAHENRMFIVDLWDTKKGRKLIERWRELVDCQVG